MKRLVWLGLLTYGCASSPAPKAEEPSGMVTTNQSAPDWFHRTSFIKDGDIYGVGVSEYIGNRSGTERRAAMFARAQVSRLFQTTLRERAAENASGNRGKSFRGITSVSSTVLSHVQVVEVWRSPREDHFGVLVVLKEEDIRHTLAAMARQAERTAERERQEAECARLKQLGKKKLPEYCIEPETTAPCSDGFADAKPRAGPPKRKIGPPPRRDTPQPGWTKKSGWIAE